MSIKVCVLIIGDRNQWSDYRDFKSDLQQHVRGRINIEDVLDIAGIHGNNQSKAIGDYLTNRDAVILVCSKKLRQCIEDRRSEEFKLKGRSIKLDGGVLKDHLNVESIKNKTILVSLDSEDDSVDIVPAFLTDRPHFNAEDDNINDQIMSCLLAE
uniref:Uncharacterized protein n=1 Tax=Clytia hemisphaerica TaxID=252671 RepID=A0A7M5U9B4_9CNID